MVQILCIMAEQEAEKVNIENVSSDIVMTQQKDVASPSGTQVIPWNHSSTF